MRMKSHILAILIVVVLFGGILASNSFGWWATESKKEAATFTEGEFAGMPNPADIRGSYTLGDVEKNFDVPVDVLAEAFLIQDENPVDFQVKNLETQYAESEVEIGTSSVRLFVALYTGLPFDLSTDIYLPEQAVQILGTRSLTDEQTEYIDTHSMTIETSGTPDGNQIIETSTPEDVPAEEEQVVKGKTTFTEILSWNVDQSVIEEIMGIQIPEDTAMTIKDFASINSLDFESLKEELQIAVDDDK